MSEPATLKQTEQRLQEAITAREPSTSAQALVRASERMTQAQRLDVYRHAYISRLQECLVEDFPVLRSALGALRFASLCSEYIASHPPRSPSLNGYGSELPGHCQRVLASEPALAELARLEWAMVELVHAPQVAALSAEALQARAADFATLRLRPIPALQLLELSHPVVALHAALRAKQSAPAPAPTASSGYALVYRSAWDVRCTSLSACAGRLLAQLIAGEPIGEALERVTDEDVSEREIMAWFQDWLAKGLFAELG